MPNYGECLELISKAKGVTKSENEEIKTSINELNSTMNKFLSCFNGENNESNESNENNENNESEGDNNVE